LHNSPTIATTAASCSASKPTAAASSRGRHASAAIAAPPTSQAAAHHGNRGDPDASIQVGSEPPSHALQALLAAHPALDFLEACGVGDAQEIARQLARDPKLATTSTAFGWTALHLAAFSGVPAAVQLLLERGAPIDARAHSKFKNTPLQAALMGRRDLVDLLLEAGAEPGSRADDGRTPVTEALRGNHAELAGYLRSKGAHDAAITADLMAPPVD